MKGELLMYTIRTYAAYYENDIRLQSSSGGIFSLLAVKFDIVYGVAMSDDCYEAHFVRIIGDISPIRGSKYLQASVGDTYIQVKNDVESGKFVLFTGTGCQVNGLKKFLGRDYDNLLCVDVVCHGVPSPALWKMYVKHRELISGRKIQMVRFRCKKNGWKNYGLLEDDVFIAKDEDPYMQMFLRDYCLRPSCYECKVKNSKLSDMTIADFWGIEKVAPELDDDKGTSLIIVRSEKAALVFEELCNNLKYKEVPYEEGVKQNSSEYSSVKKPKERDGFFVDMCAMSFAQLCQKYLKTNNSSLVVKLKRKFKAVLVKIWKIVWK